MKKYILYIGIIALLSSCGGRSSEEQKAYEDSLMHVISCSPTIVGGEYTLEDQLNACDLLIKEHPDKMKDFEQIKAIIREQIEHESIEF